MNRIILTGFSCLLGMYSFSQTWNTFTTSFGTIQLGPADANWGHIYTDRANFLFNKDIYTATGGFNASSGIGLSLR
ncbi:hypothetical protein D3C87_308450 [compost metagenome]